MQRSGTLRGGNALICGDSRVHLPRVGSETADLVVTDPPYGLASDTTIMRRAGKFGPAADIRASFDWDERPSAGWIGACLRVLRPGGTMIAFYEREHLHEIRQLFLLSMWICRATSVRIRCFHQNEKRLRDLRVNTFSFPIHAFPFRVNALFFVMNTFRFRMNTF